MVDNTVLNSGTGGDTIATDDIGGVKHQLVKVEFGAADSATQVSAAAPLPVDGSNVTQPVSGTVTANLSATDNAVLDTIDAVLDAINAKLVTGTVIGDVNLGATDNAVLDAIDAVLDTINAKLVTGTVIGDVNVSAALPAGTNNIGDVDVLTQPARDRTTDNVGAALVTDAIMQDATARTPSFAAIDAALSGDNTLVAAAGVGNKIRVVSCFLVAAGTVNARFESGAAGTALTGQMNLVANTGFVLPFNPVGWFETAANTLLNLELSGAVSVDGSLTYIVVT